MTSDANIMGKISGVLQYDDTTKKLMMASGPLAADPWQAVDGTAVITPI